MPCPCMSTQDEKTPLHCAAQSGDTEVVKALLEKGAEIEASDEVRKEGKGRPHKGPLLHSERCSGSLSAPICVLLTSVFFSVPASPLPAASNTLPRTDSLRCTMRHSPAASSWSRRCWNGARISKRLTRRGARGRPCTRPGAPAHEGCASCGAPPRRVLCPREYIFEQQLASRSRSCLNARRGAEHRCFWQRRMAIWRWPRRCWKRERTSKQRRK